MTIFNQEKQHVINQYNAARDNIIGEIQGRLDLIDELQKLKVAVIHAYQQGMLPAELATDAEYQIAKAVQQAEKAQPNKQTLLDHINTAKSLLESVQTVAGLVTGLAALAQAVQHIF